MEEISFDFPVISLPVHVQVGKANYIDVPDFEIVINAETNEVVGVLSPKQILIGKTLKKNG